MKSLLITRLLREIFLVILRPGSVRPGRVRPTWPSAISVLVRVLRNSAVSYPDVTACNRKSRTSTEIALGQVGRTRPGRTLPGRKMTKKISRSNLVINNDLIKTPMITQSQLPD